MRAAVLHEVGSPLRIEELELAGPRAGEVEVRIEAVGVCHSDYHYMTGDLTSQLPVVPGHEGAGTVITTGSGVERVAPGDRVALLWRPRCGSCTACLVGEPVRCQLGSVQARTGGLPDDGTTRLSLNGAAVHHLMGVSCLAGRVVVSEKSVVQVPADVSPRIAAIAGCAVITGVGVVLNVIGAAAGRSVLVIGAGGVGLSTVMGAHLVGAHPVIVVDVDAARLARGRELGATHVIDAGENDVVARVAEVVPSGVDWAVDAVGQPQTLQQAVAAIRSGGTAVAVGLSSVGRTVELPINDLVQQQKRVVGSLYGSANPYVDLPRLLELYRAGRLPLDGLLGDEYGLDDVNEAYAALDKGGLGRSIVVPA